MNRTAQTIAAQLRDHIGAHMRLIGDSNVSHETYQRALSASDESESLARYLADHTFGPAFARACGLDAYARKLTRDEFERRQSARFMVGNF